MNRNDVFVDQEHLYALTKDDAGGLYLEVACGGFAMYNLVIPLSQEEVADYQIDGKMSLDKLANRVTGNPSKFQVRAIE
jgi:hypothetical protein